MLIKRCYDSHLHILETGLQDLNLNLAELKNVEQLTELQTAKENFRGPILYSTGLAMFEVIQNQNLAQKLSKKFSHLPTLHIAKDGHSALINQQFLLWLEQNHSTLASPQKEQIKNSGLFLIKDKEFFSVWQKTPPASHEVKRIALIKAGEMLNNNGFTHAREMTGTLDDLELYNELCKAHDLKLYIDYCFWLQEPSEAQDLIAKIEKKRSQSAPMSEKIRANTIKIFLDGSLGSGTASLTKNKVFPNVEPLLSLPEIEQVLKICWSKKFSVAVHSIGDASADLLASAIFNLRKQGINGALNIEHAELMRPQVLKKLHGSDVRFHFQPCHFLDDANTLASLEFDKSCIFPWAEVEKAELSLHFGSDSPFSVQSLRRTQQGYSKAVEFGVSALSKSWSSYHQHPDASFGANCSTNLNEEQGLLEVFFDGQKITSSSF